MPDLAALAQIAPQYAAILAGREGANQDITSQIAQQKALDDIINQQTTRAQNTEKFPLELDQLAAGNAEKRSVTGKNISDTERLNLENARTRATQQGVIDLDNAKNAASTHQVIASHFNSLADEIENNPNVPPNIALTEAMQRRNLPPKAVQGITQGFANVPPEQLSKALRAMGDRVLRENPDYVKEMDKEREATRSKKEVANIEATSREKVANIYGTSREAAARAGHPAVDFETMLSKMPKASSRYAALNDAATKAEQANEKGLAASYRARAEALRPQAEAELAGGKPPGMDVPALAGVPAAQPPNIRPPASTQGTAQKPIIAGSAPVAAPQPGAVWQGKSGKFRFKGGDYKDPKNWEKID